MAQPPHDSENQRIVIRDPRAIRALAHPARLAIIEALGSGEELTSTECAALTGLSPSATNYHLKALEKWGFVEPGQPRADGRDRPWKAMGRGVQWDSPGPQSAPAEVAVLSAFLDRNRAIVSEFLEHEADESPEWTDSIEFSNGDYWLTSDELRQVAAAMREVLRPYRDRRRDSRPEGSRQVRVVRLISPRLSQEPQAFTPQTDSASPGGDPRTPDAGLRPAE
ncbi:MAG TPA: helix-turn-helix domain-containing protein [Streptosporangiaceae bacterium]|jgi:DNA-binding transcriptional ArsR family regulator